MTRVVSTFPAPHRMSLVQAVAKRQLRMHLRKIREREYSKLRSLVPSVAAKKKVSKVHVIEEAVRYIEELHTALVDRFREKHGCQAEDKAKETVQTFVSRMMELQQHPDPSVSSNNSTTTNTHPTASHPHSRRPAPSPFNHRIPQPVPPRLYPTPPVFQDDNRHHFPSQQSALMVRRRTGRKAV